MGQCQLRIGLIPAQQIHFEGKRGVLFCTGTATDWEAFHNGRWDNWLYTLYMHSNYRWVPLLLSYGSNMVAWDDLRMLPSRRWFVYEVLTLLRPATQLEFNWCVCVNHLRTMCNLQRCQALWFPAVFYRNVNRQNFCVAYCLQGPGLQHIDWRMKVEPKDSDEFWNTRHGIVWNIAEVYIDE